MLLAFVSSSPDSAVLSEATRKLSDRDTLGAIDVLQEWSEGNLATPAVADLLDFLQLPEDSAVWPPALQPAKPVAAPARRLWSVRTLGMVSADRELPLSGGLDLQRCFPVDAKVGASDVLAGVSVGSWLEEGGPYADLDLWTGIDLRRPDWNGRVEGWVGWTESNQPEAGISGILESKGRWNGWDYRHGPAARYSWRRARFLGWSMQALGPFSAGTLELAGTVRARQDPTWPVVLDYDTVPVRFARGKAQGLFHAALARPAGRFRYGPQLDLDGRASFVPDRWTDSVGLGPTRILTASRSERRAELGCTASAFVQWDPSPVWSAEGSLGWTWVEETSAVGLEASPFNHGLFLRLGARSRF